MEDETLNRGFDRLVELSASTRPSMAQLEGRVVARRARVRRNRQRAALAGCAVLLVLVGLGAVVLRPSDGASDQKLSSNPTRTTVVASEAAPVFTLSRVPEDLDFQWCRIGDPASATTTPAAPETVTCTYDSPLTPIADGLRITWVAGGATDEVRRAWESGDAAAAAEASGGSDDPASAEFRTLAGTKVLDLAPNGEPSSDPSGAIRVLVGDDLVDIGATNVPLTDLGLVATGLSMAPPAPYVEQALTALPKGSVAVVQGERQRWIDNGNNTARGFGGAVEGADLAVPGSVDLLSIDLTKEADVADLFDRLLASGDPAISETEIAGHRAIVVSAGATLPDDVATPRSGPQVLVETDDDGLIRVTSPTGGTDQLEAVAAALA